MRPLRKSMIVPDGSQPLAPPRFGRPAAAAFLVSLALVLGGTTSARSQTFAPGESHELPSHTSDRRAAEGYRLAEPFSPVAADAEEADDEEGAGRAKLSQKVFTDEERTEVKRLFGEYMKAEGDKKKKAEQAEKEKKEKADAEPYEIGSDTKLNAVWNNGLWFQSKNKDWNIHVGGRLQFLSSFWDEPSPLNDPPPGGGGVPNATRATRGVGQLQDGMFFRRVRLRSDGVGYDVVEYVIEVNFEQVSITTFDHMWAGFKELPVLGTVRIGQHKIPQGMEMMGSDYHLTFLERSVLSDAFWTLFGQGLFISNNYCDQNVSFQTMFGRIQPNGFFTGDFGTGDYAETSRLTWTPYYGDEGRHVVHFGGSYQWRRADLGNSIQPGGTVFADRERVVRFRARPELRDGTGVAVSPTFAGFGNTSRFVDTGFLLADSVHTMSPEFLWICGPFSVQAEAAWAVTENARTAIPGGPFPVGTPHGDLTYWGGYAQASYFLTGENRGYDRRFGVFDRPKVRENFYAVKGCDKSILCGRGAWELGYRYSYVDLNDNGLNGGEMGQHTIGLNWYFNDNFKAQFNYLNIQRGVHEPALSGTVHGFGLMTQWYF